MKRNTLVAAALLVAVGSAGVASARALQDGGKETPPVEKQADDAKKTKKVEGKALAELRAFIGEQTIDKSNKRWKTQLPKPPKAKFAEGETYFWMLETNKGTVKVKLMPEVAPMHVSSTIYLTELGFYNDLTFHRVIPNFMAQGGCPLGSGTGSPGYKYAGEFDPKVKHDRPGLLSMANAGPNTDGSQFFLTFVPTPHLDGKHTIFGEVVEGMEAIKAIEALGTSPRGQTKEPVLLKKASISTK